MKLTFALLGDPGDYLPGEEREYDVIRHGRYLGQVGRTDLVSNEVGGTPVLGWVFRMPDGRSGEGRTRQAAVAAALAQEVPS